MNLPITPAQLGALRQRYALSEFKGRLCAQCQRCATVFLVAPANLPGANLDGLLLHGMACNGSGPKRGPLPARGAPNGPPESLHKTGVTNDKTHSRS